MILNKKTLALALAFIPAQALAQGCVNSDDFVYFYENKERSCKNIRINENRRQALCPEETVNAACPQTCGQCCEDLDDFTFTRNNGQKADCAWLGEKTVRMEKYCKDIKIGFPTSTKGTVRDGCPVTCDFCFDSIAVATISPAPTATISGAPSGSPSAGPTSSPSMSPSSMPSPTPTEEPTRPPSPMPSPFPTLRPTSAPSDAPSQLPSVSPSDAPSNIPSAQPSDVPSAQPSAQPSAVPSAVPSAQPSAVPSAQPSDVPSAQPSAQPSAVPSASPSAVPSAFPSDVPSQLPSVSPSDQPSNNPTMSIKPSPLPSAAPVASITDAPTEAPVEPCVNSDTFTFTLVNEGNEVTCGWITKHINVETRQKNYCDETDIAAACPQACGSCVGDDPLFTFKLKKMGEIRDCSWITKNENRLAHRLTYCEKKNVAAGCAASCA